MQIPDTQKGLVGHWTMNFEDVDNGIVRDRSAYDSHGTINGSPKTGVFGKVGDATNFGTSSYVSADGLLGGHNLITFSFWSKPTNYKSGNSWFFNFYGDGNNRFGVFDNGSVLKLYTKLSGTAYSTSNSSSLSTGSWYHIVGKITGSTLKLYVNSSKVGESNHSGNPSNITSPTAYLNAFDGSGNYNFGQTLDDVRVYNRILSQSEIKQLYNQRSTRAHKIQKVPVAQQDLVAYYPFASPGATDQSGNGYDGTTNSGTYRSTGGHNGNGDYNLQEDYISAPVPSSVQGGGSKSLVGWSYHNSIDSGNHFYNFGTASGDQAFGWYVPNGDLKIYHFGNDSDTGYNVPTGEWVHLVLTYDGSSTSKAYVNGSLQHTYNSGSLNTGDTRLAIGGREDGTKTVPDANFSDIRIYNKELSKYEVKRLYQSEKSVFGGIEKGYKISDLTFYANQWNGSGNTGEVDITGSQFTKRNGEVVDITPIDNGVALQEDGSVSGVEGYIMYSEQSVFDRFSDNPPNSSNGDHVIGVRKNGETWEYDDNNSFHEFSPRPTDHLIAEVGWGVDFVNGLNIYS